MGISLLFLYCYKIPNQTPGNGNHYKISIVLKRKFFLSHLQSPCATTQLPSPIKHPTLRRLKSAKKPPHLWFFNHKYGSLFQMLPHSQFFNHKRGSISNYHIISAKRLYLLLHRINCLTDIVSLVLIGKGNPLRCRISIGTSTL